LSFKSIALAAALITMPVTSAFAATVSTGVTKIGDGGGIDLAGAGIAQAAFDFGVAPLAGADWVWGANGGRSTETFEYIFDLAGFDASTASLSGNIVVDNQAVLSLNGTTIASFLGDVGSHFRSLNTYSTANSSLFNSGLNTLTFTVEDFGGGFGLRANATVLADSVSAVTVPAALPLLIGGIAGLSLFGRRKTAR